MKRKDGGIKFTKYGTIKGGACEQTHEKRSQRESGARMYLARVEKIGGITRAHGWCHIVKVPRIPPSEVWAIGAKMGAAYEVGWYRFEQDVIKPLKKLGKAFREKWMDGWVEGVCAHEFFGGKVHNDALYKTKKDNGDFTP